MLIAQTGKWYFSYTCFNPDNYEVSANVKLQIYTWQIPKHNGTHILKNVAWGLTYNAICSRLGGKLQWSSGIHSLKFIPNSRQGICTVDSRDSSGLSTRN